MHEQGIIRQTGFFLSVDVAWLPVSTGNHCAQQKKSICETSKFGMNFGEVQVLSQYKERH